MVMIGDEGQSDEGQAMESLGTGVTGGLLPSLLLCFFASLLEGRACRRNGGGSFNYLLFYLFYYG